MTTYTGTYYEDVRSWVTPGQLLLPAAITIYKADGTTPAVLYADIARVAAQRNSPVDVAVDVGLPGLDIYGNLLFRADPGHYTVGIAAARFPVVLYNDPAEPPPISGSAGFTLKLATASPRTITNQASTGSGLVLTDLGFVVNPGQIFRFDGCIYTNATRAAGIRLMVGATGTGVALACVMRGPNFVDTGQFDVTEHRETTITIPNNGAQQFGGFAASGLSNAYIEIIGGLVSLPAAAPAAGAVIWTIAQAAATADVTSVIDLISALTVVRLA